MSYCISFLCWKSSTAPWCLSKLERACKLTWIYFFLYIDFTINFTGVVSRFKAIMSIQYRTYCLCWVLVFFIFCFLRCALFSEQAVTASGTFVCPFSVYKDDQKSNRIHRIPVVQAITTEAFQWCKDCDFAATAQFPGAWLKTNHRITFILL